MINKCIHTTITRNTLSSAANNLIRGMSSSATTLSSILTPAASSLSSLSKMEGKFRDTKVEYNDLLYTSSSSSYPYSVAKEEGELLSKMNDCHNNDRSDQVGDSSKTSKHMALSEIFS